MSKGGHGEHVTSDSALEHDYRFFGLLWYIFQNIRGQRELFNKLNNSQAVSLSQKHFCVFTKVPLEFRFFSRFVVYHFSVPAQRKLSPGLVAGATGVDISEHQRLLQPRGEASAGFAASPPPFSCCAAWPRGCFIKSLNFSNAFYTLWIPN